MARNQKSKRFKNKYKAKPKYSTYDREGFSFRFDDEQLQQRYITTWKHFNNILGGNEGLPHPSVISYAHAVGLTRGKTYEEISDLEDIYTDLKDHKYNSGGKHKYGLFEEERQKVSGSKTIEKFIKQMNNFMQEVNKATQEVPTKEKILRYNIVWYQRHPQT